MSLKAKEIYEFGPYCLNLDEATLNKGDEAILLAPKLFELLTVLVLKRGAVVSKEELFEAVWADAFVEESNLTQSIFTLRKRLGKTEAGEDYIQTIPRRGYRIKVPVIEVGVATGQEAAQMEQAQISGSGSRLAGGRRPGLSWIVPTALMLAAVLVAVLVFALVSRTRPEGVEGVAYMQLTRDGLDKRGSAHTRAGPVAALATDGTRIYFTEGSAGETKLAEVSVAGGETATIPVPFQMTQLLDYSPVHSELLVGGYSDPYSVQRLWAVSVPGGASHPIGDLQASDAGWSPDGSELAFIHGTALYRSSSDGFQVTLISNLPGVAWRPRWSPNAQTIRVTILDKDTKNPTLWEIDVNGSHLHPMFPGWNASSPQCCGQWSSDGKKFVFQATRDGKTEIWSIAETNRLTRLLGFGSPQRITTAPLDLLAPIPSPDGASLYVMGEQLRGEVVRYDSGLRQFLPYLGGKSLEYLEFSRDGGWITYVAYPEGTLWRSRPDGSERLQLTFAPMGAMLPHWSPDGREILFHGYGAGLANHDYTISALGGVPKLVFADEVMTPDWTPDGQSFVYSDFPFFETKPEDTGVHIFNIKTGQKTTVPDSAGIVNPVWSPDGHYIAASRASGNDETMLFDTRAQTWGHLVESRGIPRWSHDSQWLYYFGVGSEPAIMRIRISDRRVEMAADLRSVRLAGRLAGVQFSLAPDDSPILLRDTGSEEIYSVALRAK